MKLLKKNIKKITIIIFSYDRQEDLKKKILIYKKKYRLVILDRSINSISNFCKSNLSNDSHYFHYPKKSYFQRLILSKKFLNTKYVMLQTDDDFFFEENISKNINFLETHKNYSCVGGRAYVFNMFNNQIYLRNINENMWSLNSVNYKSRVESVLKGSFDNIYYSVMRSSVFMKHVELLRRNLLIYKNEMYGYHHLQLLILLALCGKIKILNEIFYIRNSNSPRRAWPNSHTYMIINIYDKFKKGYLDKFIKNILLFLGKDNYNNQLLLKKNLERYFLSRSKIKKKLLFFKKNFIFFIFKILIPDQVQKYIKFKIGFNGELFDRNWYSKSNIKYSYENYVKIKECKQYFNR
jgi:glycosyltransferase domain-containing protein